MTKRQFCVEIADRAGTDLETATALFEAHEDLIMEIIATEDQINFTWGKIYGYFREPRKVYGPYAYLASVKARGGWSVAKSGMPGIEWSTEAKQYTPIDPTELYCEWDECKFTSKARAYRQDRKLPEIPEYNGLPEEMIKDLMEKADEKRYGKKTKKMIKEEAMYRLEKAKASAARNHIIRLEWIDQKIKQGMDPEEAKAVPLAVILDERRKDWQKAVKAYETALATGQISEEDRKVKGQLNPYEIYKENSMADYYKHLMEENVDLNDEELIEIMKKDLDEMAENIDDLSASEKDYFGQEQDNQDEKVQYDDEGYRIDKNGNKLEYWQSLDVVYKKNSRWQKNRKKNMKRETKGK